MKKNSKIGKDINDRGKLPLIESAWLHLEELQKMVEKMSLKELVKEEGSMLKNINLAKSFIKKALREYDSNVALCSRLSFATNTLIPRIISIIEFEQVEVRKHVLDEMIYLTMELLAPYI